MEEQFEERADYVDIVAQAVIDKIEERSRLAGLVEMVAARVMELQKEESELNQIAQCKADTRRNESLEDTVRGNGS